MDGTCVNVGDCTKINCTWGLATDSLCSTVRAQGLGCSIAASKSQQTSKNSFSANCGISYLLGSTGVELFSQSLQLLLTDEGVTLNSKRQKLWFLCMGNKITSFNCLCRANNAEMYKILKFGPVVSLTWLKEESLSEQLSLYWLLDWQRCFSRTSSSFLSWSSSSLLIKDSTTTIIEFFKLCTICRYL